MTGRVTLEMLLDSLGPEVVRPIALPEGGDVPVSVPVIYDPAEPLNEGAVLLVAGHPQPDLVARAVKAGVAAIVTRHAVPSEPGVALLLADPAVSWGQLYMLIDTMLAVVGPAAPGEPGDLFALANQVAARIGGAVTIEDLAMRVLAYSTIEDQRIDDLRRDGILGLRVPAHPTHAEEYAAVLRTGSAIWSFVPAEYLPRLAIAVRARGDAIGTIWVVEGDRPLAPDAAEILAEAATAAAPHLARFNLAADQVRRRRAEQLGALLRGTGQLEDLADALGLEPDQPVTVVVISRHDGPVDAIHAGDLLRTAFSAYRIRAVAGVVEGRAYGVVATGSDAALLRRIVEDVVSRLGPDARAGIGRTARALAGAPASARQAEAVLSVLDGPFGRGSVGRYEDLAAALLLAELAAALRGRPALIGEPLSLVAEHDAAHGTDYLHSLRAWFAAYFDVPRAAEVLSLHPNTLRYRLRRISELIDLDDPDTRLALVIQLRLRRTPDRNPTPCPDGAYGDAERHGTAD
ncbi:PucR family transcriptional regulator [Streptosporangium roseum]|uniref:PucR family transcriptional regulator n=1 Tax=Streptosporangium roseum TaxID=2001 RepID=UPI0004CCD606|nr:helix-turn-helix domain-containing protein [Streptosporangium roseum]